MPVLKLPMMSIEEVNGLINGQIMCRIAFQDEEYPYIAPFQYVVIDEILYFHFTDYGKKMKLLEKNDRVCVQIEKYEPDLSSYQFVSMRGRLDIVSDEDERKCAIDGLSKLGKTQLSTNFLAAHGINPEDGWGFLSSDKPFVIVKLVDVVNLVGLRSPR